MSSTSDQRKKLFVDQSVQKAIIRRLFAYWIASVLFLVLPLALFNCARDPSINFVVHVGLVFQAHWPILATLTMLLPVMVLDFIKLSNRFVGPIYQLRSRLSQFGETGQLEPVQFREKDFWNDLSEGINAVADRLEDLESQMVRESEADSVGVS